MSFQADTAAKVTAAISAKPAEEGAPAPEMKLEDLEKHLDALKQMFIEKQKMMEQVGSNRPPQVYWRRKLPHGIFGQKGLRNQY